MKKFALALLALSSSLMALENTGQNKKTEKSYWKTENNLIIGENADKNNSVFWTEKKFGNYELVIQWQNRFQRL